MLFPPLAAVSGLQFGLENLSLPSLVIAGLLAVLSMASWTVLMAKWALLRRSARENGLFMGKFRESPHPLALYLTRERMVMSPMYHVYHEACRELAFYLVGEEEPGRTFNSRLQGAGRITSSQMGAVQNAMERAVVMTANKAEMRLGVLSTVLAVAPFLGLFGTVWGLLDVFAVLAQTEGTAGLSALAPGICSALLTTLLAIFVTVPSLMAYNFLVSRIRNLIVRVENFANELSGILDRQFVDHRSPDESLPSLGEMGTPMMPGFSSPPSQALTPPAKLTTA
ncbi:Cell division and transport-associated protein TolQ [Prosthecobacter debontii]|uniref:Cell division and transport-associated protein TolQ n=1 Tax=Prosthecobacter debontii TaxID=48467 RepID=A0A1T4XG12_9BACT|nr:MotA/TolQ/ExbB proton channel family protein [Prosthecobacter debontii]SKA88460.1 Cell division and transport-associated protein TolQ [Prosthecobacter debontii]